MKQSTFALLAVAILIVFLSSLFGGCTKPKGQQQQNEAAASFESSGEYQMYVDNDFITIYEGTRLVKKVPLKESDPVGEAIIEDNL